MKYLKYFEDLGLIQKDLANQGTQTFVKKPVNPRKPLPSETDDVEQIKTQIDQDKQNLLATKDNIEKMQIDSFEEPNQQAVKDKVAQYKTKTDEIGKLVKNFDTTIKNIKTKNKPTPSYRSQEDQARQENL